MSTESLAKLKEFEGCRLTAYQDSVGVWTIGYGTTRGIKRGMKITQEQADKLLTDFVEELEKELKAIKGLNELSAPRWDAIVDFAYNLGTRNLKNSTLLKKIQKNVEDLSIPYEFGRWCRAGGKILPGLVKRRAWEASMWSRG